MKRFLSIVLFCALLVSSLTLCACNQDDSASSADITEMTVNRYEGEYDRWEASFQEEYVRRTYNVSCEGIELDGVVNDDEWGDFGWEEYTQYGITIKFTLTYNVNGIFWAMDSTDTDIHFNLTNYPEANTSFEVLVTTADNDSKSPTDNALQARHDLSAYAKTLVGRNINNSWTWANSQEDCFHKWSLKGENAVLINGVSEKNEGWQCEGFIAWTCIDLDVKTEEDVPEQIRVFTQYNYQDSLNKSSRVDYVRPYALYDSERSWYFFDEKGFITGDNRIEAEQGSSVLLGDGHSDNGTLGKTADWDLSRAGEGIISLNKAYDAQWIFFKDVNATEYIVSADIEASQTTTYSAGDARLGIIAGMRLSSTDIAYNNILLLGVGSNSSVDGKLSYSNFAKDMNYNVWGREIGPNGTAITTSNVSGNWFTLSDAYGNTSAKTGKVNLTVIKRGAVIVYLVNNVLWKIVTNVELAGNTVPGFYSNNWEGTFSNITCTTDSTAIDNKMSEIGLYNIKLVNESTSENVGTVTGQVYEGFNKFGGEFTSSMLAQDGNSVIFDISAVSSKLKATALETFTVNGVDKMSEIVDGKYTITNVTEDVEIKYSFKTIKDNKVLTVSAQADDTIVFYAYDEDGENILFTYESTFTSASMQTRLGYGFYKVVLNGDNTGARYIEVTADGIYERDSDGNAISTKLDAITTLEY